MIAPPDWLVDGEQTPLAQTIARSGLVEGLALHRAIGHVAGQRPTSVGDHDRRLAERLLELGVLNAWQVEQLKRGRTKFKLGAYRVLDSIGSGGMGHVFLGEHELLGRREAIKVLPRVKSTPEAIAGFRHEMRAQALLDHPNLVRVSYADRDGETYFLVTEYVPGIDLRRLIRRRGPLSPPQAAWVVSQAAEAIDYAHRRGLVHRDVKPGNLLLTPEGAVKVTDLGLAWSFDSGLGSEAVYQRGKIAGTSDYLAPEAIRHPGDVLPESDLYGLGCTLYYAITGKVPYPGGTHAEKLRRRLRERPIDPRQLVTGAPDEMLALIRALMEPDPRNRPATAGAVARALALLCDSRAQQSLGALVRATVETRSTGEETPPAWPSSEGDELPETIGGLPMHDVYEAEPPRPRRGWREAAPRLIAVGLLGLSVVISTLTVWRLLSR